MNALQTLRTAYQTTDDAWGVELRRLFGNGAGDVRYTRVGKGADGSELRRLHDARESARVAYELARREALYAADDRDADARDADYFGTFGNQS